MQSCLKRVSGKGRSDFGTVAAKELGKQTHLASLEVGLDPNEIVGACDCGDSCAYSNTLCWRSPTTPMPMENHPLSVFERLFGDSESTDAKARRERFEEDRSVLDYIRQDVARLLHDVGPADRAKLTEYLDAVRDVERRIRLGEEQSSCELPSIERPVGVPATFTEHAKLILLSVGLLCKRSRIADLASNRSPDYDDQLLIESIFNGP